MVMLAHDRPGDAGIAVGDRARRVHICRSGKPPSEKPGPGSCSIPVLLGPVHTHVVMDEANLHQLHLRGVPECVVSLRVFQLAFTILQLKGS